MGLTSPIDIATRGTSANTINGNGNGTSASGNSRHFLLDDSVALTLHNIDIVDGSLKPGTLWMCSRDGVIRTTIDINNNRVCDDTASFPGEEALAFDSVATVTGTGSVFYNNKCIGSGVRYNNFGGILALANRVFYGNHAGAGGAIFSAGL